MKIKYCPKCNYNKHWVIRRGKLKCIRCRYEWNPNKLPLRLTFAQWRKILRYFVLELSSNKVAYQTGISKKRILRALNITREIMLKDIPDVFKGQLEQVEADETYIEGQLRNKRKSESAEGTKQSRRTSKQSVFGILCRNGYVWAKIVSDVEAQTLLPLIRKKVKHGSIIYSGACRAYTGIAAKGYVHRLVEHNKGEFSNQKGSHIINSLEGFWGYLKRNLASTGGIRRERLPLYVGEYVWRFNHHSYSIDEQVKKLLNLLKNSITHKNWWL